MLHQSLFTLFTLLFTISASPLYTHSSVSLRDVAQTQSSRTTTCLSTYFGGCCVVDGYGVYGSCTNATLLAENVAWNGIPTTLTANEWACTSLIDGKVISTGCCEWSESYVDVTYPNGVIVPTLEKSMACTASSAGVSKRTEELESGKVI
ncbi:34c6d88d-a660-4090-abc1-af2fb214cc21 [Sclerotinia trifoliorum]|uniref:34c6d88d-a660-4090-abc1-af2fb214cc21 n=1 Tax=Sclerotinia trifoliorum TaxID=28548 RepID=A0A8H2W1H6_9HELO|nr:34c6d88d-a660-4090-abc1-af2fb214cc21 [Sclerotinia trifoliorum]